MLFTHNLSKPKPAPMIPTQLIAVPSTANGSSWHLDQGQCNWIVDYVKKNLKGSYGGVGMGDVARVDRKIRDVGVFALPYNAETEMVYAKLMSVIEEVNKDYKFEIYGIPHEIQILCYQDKGHYDWHLDIGGEESAGRKISMVVQLSDPNDYEGCNLELASQSQVMTAPREQGTVVTFPSYILHRVTPLNKGIRWSLVTWVSGYNNFR